ncbi:MAG: adenylate/guanylate cyclase domain-containing protein [Pseudomonadota bacterium]
MAIKYKIALSFSLLLVLILAAFWLSLKLQLEQTLSRQTDTLGQILARQTADSITELVLANDLLGLNVVINQLAGEQGVASITIQDVDGKILVTTSGAEAENSGSAYVAPITLQDAVAGTVSLYLDESLQNNPVAQPHGLFYLIIGAGVILVAVTAWALASHLTQPLQELLEQTEINDLDDDLPEIIVTRQDEIGQVQQRFLELMTRQRELEDHIEVTGLPDPALEEQTGSKPERRMATLLVVQVVNSNTALELLHPATLSTLLQQYQYYLRQAARLYRGVVNRINGDTMLVSFDIRQCQEEHAFNAICCAQLFLSLMEKVAANHHARNAQALDFNVAVHSGAVYFSPIWIKQRAEGDKTRPESVIGKPVELVGDLLAHGQPNTIIVSELSYDLAEGNTRFATDNAEQINVGTDNLAVVTYSLSAATGNHSELLERQCQHLLPETIRTTMTSVE